MRNTKAQSGLQRGQVSGAKLRKTATLTPAKKKFVEEYAKLDNGAEAVRRAYPELKDSSPQYLSTKAARLMKNDEIINHLEHQKQKLEKLATKAVEKVEQLIESENEQIATTNAWKTIEQVQGKAMTKNLSITATDTLEEVLKRLQGN